MAPKSVVGQLELPQLILFQSVLAVACLTLSVIGMVLVFQRLLTWRPISGETAPPTPSPVSENQLVSLNKSILV